MTSISSAEPPGAAAEMVSKLLTVRPLLDVGERGAGTGCIIVFIINNNSQHDYFFSIEFQRLGSN